MSKITVFSGAKGLNTKTDPVRIDFNPKTGVTDLAAAVNVDIDDTGRISRRKGFTKVKTADCHSLFCDGGECVYASGTSLYILGSDYTSRSVATVTEGAKLSYAQVNDVLFYTNGYEKGLIRDGVADDWEKGTYVGPTTDREISNPPIGTHIGWYKARMYVSQANVVWYSEPFSYGAFDLARNHLLFANPVTMIRPVKSGIFFSTSDKTYYVGGDEPREFNLRLVADYPAISYTDCSTTLRVLFDKNGNPFFNLSGGAKSAIWNSIHGPCYGASDGSFYALLEDKITLPNGITGSGLVTGSRYIALTNP